MSAWTIPISSFHLGAAVFGIINEPHCIWIFIPFLAPELRLASNQLCSRGVLSLDSKGWDLAACPVCPDSTVHSTLYGKGSSNETRFMLFTPLPSSFPNISDKGNL